MRITNRERRRKMIPLLKLKNVSKNYASLKSFRHYTDSSQDVLKNINFSIHSGESIGLIGESGCGKTTLAKIAAGLEKPTAGQVLYSGTDIQKFNFTTMQRVRKDVQIIFQSSKSIFNPYHTIGKSLRHALENFEDLSEHEMKNKIAAMLERVGLDASFADRYPEKLSGGQRQRANIARALIVSPKLIICDEPVASLDFSIRKKTLDMLNELIREMSLTCLFISHDISTVRYTCKKIAVMYRGVIVELFSLEEGNSLKPEHPYSRMLLNSVPICHPRQRTERRPIPPSCFGKEEFKGNGCVFYDLCDCKQPRCADTTPELNELGKAHYLACHRYSL